MHAAVPPEDPAGRVHHLAGPRGPGAPELHEAGRVTIGDEADLLRFGLGRRGEPGARGDGPHLRLGQVPHGEEDVGEFRLPQAVEEVALVLPGIGPGEQRQPVPARLHPGVVAGREPGAQRAGPAEEPVELHLRIAGDAGVGREPGQVIVHESVDHPPPELLLHVGHVEGNPQVARHRARVLEVVRRTAGAPTGTVGEVVDAHRDAGHLVALRDQEGGRGRRVDAAR